MGDEIDEIEIALDEIDDLEQGDERVGQMRRRNEFEIVGRGVILGIFAMRRAAKTADGKVEARRAVLPLVVAVRREIADLERRAFAPQDCSTARSISALRRRLRL